MADGHIHKHLQSMFHLLRSEETLKMAVKLESTRCGRTRYLVVVSCTRKQPAQRKSTSSTATAPSPPPTSQHFNHLITAQHVTGDKSAANHRTAATEHPCNNGAAVPSPIRKSALNNSAAKPLMNEKDLTNCNIINHVQQLHHQPQSQQQQQHQPPANVNEIEESCLLGIDCNEKTTVGLVVRILGDTTIRLDGDGGFCIGGSGRTHIFKPVSVQAMWSALQTLHKVCAKARENNLYPSRPSHEWATHYDERINSEQSCLNEWNAMDSLETRRPPSPDAIRSKPTGREETENNIRTTLKEIIVRLDLDEVTSKYIRTRLEEQLDMNLTEYKSFIDEEMLKILKQLDAPTKIFDHVYLGSEWNASNLEELQKNGVRHILNVTREIDNFFPGMFEYCNVRVYDDEKTDLLKHWDDTYKYISQAKNAGSNVLVHCKMGISRSASVVIAYAMKAYGWSFAEAIDHVKNNRNCVKPNKNFLNQLETYQGMLLAMKNKEKLQRSKSDTNLRSTKDARLLPGSEPTPLIQAFNAAAKKEHINVLRDRFDNSCNRPKSWSPDSVESAVLLPRQHSQSLENLPPGNVVTVRLKNNMRLPCKNGQNYSVSQNQVFHLEESSVMAQCMTNVKLIVNELESNQKRRSEMAKVCNREAAAAAAAAAVAMAAADADARMAVDPGRNEANRLAGKPPICAAAACERTSPFGSLKRSESNRSKGEYDSHSEKYSPVMKSRSLDVSHANHTASNAINAPLNNNTTAVAVVATVAVAVATGNNNNNNNNNRSPFGSPNNRHSMHEDASSNRDNNNIAAMWSHRFTNAPMLTNSNNNAPRSASSTSNSSSSSNASLSSVSTDLINDLCKTGSKNVKNLRNAYSLREKNATSPNVNRSSDGGGGGGGGVPFINRRILLSDSDSDSSSFVHMTIARLADQFSKDIVHHFKKRCKSDGMLYESHILSTVNKRFSSSSAGDYTAKAIANRTAIGWTNRLACTKNNNQKAKRLKNRSLCPTVENLKLNFESKDSAKEPKRGKSLPSSPIASIYAGSGAATTEPAAALKMNYDKLGCEEISVKGLVDKYEVTKLKNEPPSAPPPAAPMPPAAAAIAPATAARFKRHTIHQSPQHNAIHPKPPPIPHAAAAKSPNNILLAKPLQQNSQSFARLKEQFNSASAYNTM